MNLGDIIIWETTNLLLLIPVVLGLVMLTRWVRGQTVFTERDWVFLFGHPRKKALSLRLWARFAVLFLVTITIGFAPWAITFCRRAGNCSRARCSLLAPESCSSNVYSEAVECITRAITTAPKSD
jgi:hypothetical protein